MEKRLAKAIEIKNALKNLDIIEDPELYPELSKFSKILNEWVIKDEWNNGYIKITNLKKKIVYDIREPDKTVVILRAID